MLKTFEVAPTFSRFDPRVTCESFYANRLKSRIERTQAACCRAGYIIKLLRSVWQASHIAAAPARSLARGRLAAGAGLTIEGLHSQVNLRGPSELARSVWGWLERGHVQHRLERTFAHRGGCDRGNWTEGVA